MRAFERRLFHFTHKKAMLSTSHMYHFSFFFIFHVTGVIVCRNRMLFELEVHELT